jgi:arylsulfatase A-like enzyme
VRPNILLIVLDAARRDALSPYGAGAAATPAIDVLAARGTALPRAYATASWTLPSHASMLTGLLPRALGLGQAPGGSPQSARPVLTELSERLLPRVLGAAGYECRGFSANLWVSPHSGFDAGFDSFLYLDGGRSERLNRQLRGGLRAGAAWAAEGLRARGDHGAAALGRALRESITGWSGAPAFWFVNLVECHSPYLPPRPWNDLPAPARVAAALDFQRHLTFESICLAATGRRALPERSLRRMRHLYGRAVSYLDAWVGGVLGALHGRGILERTLVIVTSDHGESFGEGGTIAHGFSLAEPLINVPLVLAGPGAEAIERVFSLAELPALIAAAAGVAEHPYGTAEPAGCAVAQRDPLAPLDDPRIRAFAERWSLRDEELARLTRGEACAVDARHKLVRDDRGTELLYDLRADPGELAPLPATGPEAGALRAALDLAQAGDSERMRRSGEAATSAASPAELAALERRLKLLGYM